MKLFDEVKETDKLNFCLIFWDKSKIFFLPKNDWLKKKLNLRVSLNFSNFRKNIFICFYIFIKKI